MAEFAINGARQESTGFSPFYLTYGEEPITPIDRLNPQVGRDVPGVEKIVEAITEALRQAKENILKAQATQKKQVDKHKRNHGIGPGDLVLLDNRNLRLKGGKKLQARYIGPFRVIDKIGNDNF